MRHQSISSVCVCSASQASVRLEDLLRLSALGDLISAKRVTAGLRATQWLGQVSDAAPQQLSRDRGIELRDRAVMDKVVEPQSELVARFGEQYGAGHKLG